MEQDIGFTDYEYFQDCVECNGTGFIIADGVAHPCTCWKQDSLLARIKKANIPSEYWYSALDMLHDTVYGKYLDFSNIDFEKESKSSSKPILRKINIHGYMKHELASLHHRRKTGESLFFLGKNGVGKTRNLIFSICICICQIYFVSIFFGSSIIKK